MRHSQRPRRISPAPQHARQRAGCQAALSGWFVSHHQPPMRAALSGITENIVCVSSADVRSHRRSWAGKHSYPVTILLHSRIIAFTGQRRGRASHRSSLPGLALNGKGGKKSRVLHEINGYGTSIIGAAAENVGLQSDQMEHVGKLQRFCSQPAPARGRSHSRRRLM